MPKNNRLSTLISEALDIPEVEAQRIYEKVVAGGELVGLETPEQWFSERFLPNLVWIDEMGYSRMCIDALKVVQKTASTDYGTSRQRDLGQHWADTTRGYLAEYAFKLFLEKRWNIQADLGHEQGDLADYVASDIHQIRDASGQSRLPQINIGIKATKWNGIWLDIPGNFHKSNIHSLVKVGVTTDHLFAYFAHISVFKDKILGRAIAQGILNVSEAETIFDSLPQFKNVPAYICGFVDTSTPYPVLNYQGKMGRKNYTITTWAGDYTPGDMAKIKAQEEIGGSVKFEGIGQFTEAKRYLFNTGSLLWRTQDWENLVIQRL